MSLLRPYKGDTHLHTNRFYVMRGEEVRLEGGSYFHVVSLNACRYVSALFEERSDYVKTEIECIVAKEDFSALPDPCAAARRRLGTAQ